MKKKTVFQIIIIPAVIILISCFSGSYLNIFEYYNTSGNAAVTGFSAGEVHSLYIINSDLIAAGYNCNGELGIIEPQFVSTEDTDDYEDWNICKYPQYVMSGVKSVTAGAYSSYIIKSDNSLWVTGSGSSGKLGTGDVENIAPPVQLMTEVEAVSCGTSHTLVLKTDGSLWAFGDNEYGQLGTGDNDARYTPVLVMEDVSSMDAGSDHSMILKTDGTLWATGRNSSGQLGMGIGMSYDQSTPVQIMPEVASVSAGSFHSLIIKTDNTLWGCGSNGDNAFSESSAYRYEAPVQLMSNVKAAYAGTFCSMIIMSDDSLRVIGANHYGQLATDVDPLAQYRDDEVITVYTEVMTGVESVSVSMQYSSYSYNSVYSLILKKDGSLWAAGNNDYGQFGIGTRTDAYHPVRIY